MAPVHCAGRHRKGQLVGVQVPRWRSDRPRYAHHRNRRGGEDARLEEGSDHQVDPQRLQIALQQIGQQVDVDRAEEDDKGEHALRHLAAVQLGHQEVSSKVGRQVADEKVDEAGEEASISECLTEEG